MPGDKVSKVSYDYSNIEAINAIQRYNKNKNTKIESMAFKNFSTEIIVYILGKFPVYKHLYSQGV